MRYSTQTTTLAFSFLFTLSPFSQAQSQAQSAGSTHESSDSSIPYESSNAEPLARKDRWSDFLPIWGAEARAQGYVLPRPFGVSLGYMGQKQFFDVEGVEVEGIDVKTSGLAVINEVDNQEDTQTLRFDVWLFPFFNIYGILGKTEGEAEGPLTIDPSKLLGAACALPSVDCSPINTQFALDYKGDVAGGGLTIAGGYKNFFGMIDSNYTVTDLDISSVDAKAIVTSARLGWNGKVGGFTGAVWLGAMHQDIAQTLDLEFDVPPGLENALGKPTLEVSVEQSTQSPLNTVVGGRWEIGRGFEMLAEFGVGDRRSNMINFTYRF